MAHAPASYLGNGWAFPPSFSGATNEVTMVAGEEDIRQSLRILLSTPLGARLMRPQFGTLLWESVFGGISTTMLTELADMVRRAIVNWEPRVDVEEVDARVDPAVPGLVHLDVTYTVRQTNARSNFVYPFYIEEGAPVPQSE